MYYTFGSSLKFPFQDTYIEIKGEKLTGRISHKAFKNYFPNREGSDCLNCSDYYKPEEIEVIRKYYPHPPACVIELPPSYIRILSYICDFEDETGYNSGITVTFKDDRYFVRLNDGQENCYTDSNEAANFINVMLLGMSTILKEVQHENFCR